MKTRKFPALLLALAMALSLCCGAMATDYEPVSISEGEPVKIQWNGTTGAVVSVDGSGYIPASFILWVEGNDTITVDGASQSASYTSAEGGNYAFEIATKDTSITIVAVSGGVTYTITCPAKSAAQENDSTPTGFVGYLPIGQYATGSAWGSPYSDGTASAGSTPKVVGNYSSTGVSLGAAGGYVEYDMYVTNSDTTPYGVDFIVYGNAFVGNPEAASVKVYGKPDGSNTYGWYELAGSLYYADETLRNVDVTYKKVTADTVDSTFTSAGIWYKIEQDGVTLRGWTKFNNNTNVNWWPEESEGYLGDNGVWGGVDDVVISADQTEITYQNITLVRDTDATADYAFGYADITPNGSNYGTPANPYVYGTTGGNAYDISWAVDEDGEPVRLTTISKIRVYTSAALNISSADAPIFTVPAIFGETSAEVCGIYAVTGTGTGTSEAPSILIDGYQDLAGLVDMGATVTQIGNVTVYDVSSLGAVTQGSVVTATVSSGNLYINESASGSYTVPSGINYIRIISQNGTASPSITLIRF